MTSTNINKFVKSNINIKPWMLSKNTTQIVNNYIQKIYKQMPASFNKDNKVVKVASPRTENMGPLRAFKCQQGQKPVATITPLTTPPKKSTTKLKSAENLINSLKLSNKNNQQMANKFSASTSVGPNKRFIKSPNYKIYKSHRFGSSASSSRSSIFRKHDDRKRLKSSYPSQINYLIRSFHNGQFEPTYARYLMPARNQQLEASLGSIPDAVKFSLDIQNDLMKIDNFTKNQTLNNKKTNVKLSEPKRFESWNHPPSISKFRIPSPKNSYTKNINIMAERNLRGTKLSPEHRDYAWMHNLRPAQLRHSKPPNELFTAQHDRNKTELHEKHRRNRMRKLGLIETPTPVESEDQEDQGEERSRTYVRRREISDISLTTKAAKTSANHIKPIETKSSVNLKTNLNLKTPNTNKDKQQSASSKNENPKILDKPQMKTKKENPNNLVKNIPLKGPLPCKDLSSLSSTSSYRTQSIIAPIAAARAQMPSHNSYRTFRYNRTDFFATQKY
ncbi:uncharacterized protein ACRADG_007641 [Cochliomyia hominivorax]